jgi:H+/gluconate symporter-like permease
MGLFGILLGLALLVWLAYRGWSILLLAPGAALIAAAFAGGLSWTPKMRQLAKVEPCP